MLEKILNKIRILRGWKVMQSKSGERELCLVGIVPVCIPFTVILAHIFSNSQFNTCLQEVSSAENWSQRPKHCAFTEIFRGHVTHILLFQTEDIEYNCHLFLDYSGPLSLWTVINVQYSNIVLHLLFRFSFPALDIKAVTSAVNEPSSNNPPILCSF